MEALLADVAGSVLAIPMTQIVRTLDVVEVTPLPGAPAPIAGLLVVDTDIIPAIDLNCVSDPHSHASRPYAVIVKTAGGPIAMLVDGVSRSANIEVDDTLVRAPDGTVEMLMGDDVVLLVDVEMICERAFDAAWTDLTIQNARMADVEDESEEDDTTDASLPHLLVSVNSRIYAVMLSDIVQVDRDVTPTSHVVQDGVVRGRYWTHGLGLPAVCSSTLLFNIPGAKQVDIVLLRSERGRFALAVDSILGIRNCVRFGSASDRGKFWEGFVIWQETDKTPVEPAAILRVGEIAAMIEGDFGDTEEVREQSLATILPNFLGLRVGAKAYLIDPQVIEGIRAKSGIIFSPSAIEGEQGRTVLAELDQRFAAVVSLNPDAPLDTLERPYWAEFQVKGVPYLLGIDRLIGFRQVPRSNFETLAGANTSYTVMDGEIATLLDFADLAAKAPVEASGAM